MTRTTDGASSSGLAKLLLTLLALCVLSMAAAAASASAADTIAITAPSSTSKNTSSDVFATGHADAQSYVRVFATLNGSGAACPANPDTTDPNTHQLNPGPQIVPGNAAYSKTFTFYPQSSGTYVLCGYLLGSPEVASAPHTVTVSAELPQVQTTSAVSVTGLTATLRGGASTTGSDGSWHFEYGTDTNYGQTTPSVAMSPGAQNGAVAADVYGLTPSTTYHYRTVATNGGGTKKGADATFTTAPPSSLALSAPDRKDDEQWPISITGSAGTTSDVFVSLELGGSSCAPTAAQQRGRPGSVNYSPTQVQAGPFSTLGGGGFPQPPQETAGVYLVCGYVLSRERPDLNAPPEAISSTSVTVTHSPCPDTRFSVALGRTKVGYAGTLAITTPTDESLSVSRLVLIKSSDLGVETEQEDHSLFVEKGGTNEFGLTPAFDTTYTRSFSRPVSVTYTLTYEAYSSHRMCELPDGTLLRSVEGRPPTLASAPIQFVVTYRNGKAVGGGVDGTPAEAPIDEDEGRADPAVGIAVRSLAGAIVPKGAAAKIGAIVKKGGYKAKLKAAKPGTAKVVWTAVPPATDGPKAAAAKPVVLATGAKKFKRAGKGALKIALTKKGKAMLKKADSALQVKVAGSFTPKGKKKVTITRVVTLKR